MVEEGCPGEGGWVGGWKSGAGGWKSVAARLGCSGEKEESWDALLHMYASADWSPHTHPVHLQAPFPSA